MSSIYGTPRMQDHPVRPITLEQRAALRHAAERLGHEFAGSYGPQTIERFLHACYAEFDHARVVTYLPLLAERLARQRLQALARIEGLHRGGKPVVFFLCPHNAVRSQMAIGFFTHHAGDTAVAWSGGSAPATSINPVAVAAMAERGIDISDQYPQPWTEEVIRAADLVITMGSHIRRPALPGTRHRDWDVADSDGLDLAGMRLIRDDIERRVLDLIDQLNPADGTA